MCGSDSDLHIDSKCDPDNNRNYTGVKMRYWHCHPWGHGKCRDNQLVCSTNRRSIPGNGHQLHYAKYKCNDNILCRCNE